MGDAALDPRGLPGARAIAMMARRIALSVRRARGPIIASAVTYVGFVVLGVALATAGLPFAVSQRDSIVGSARSSPVTQAYRDGNRFEAALLDFGSNVFLGAVPTSVMGLSVIGPFPIAAYRGWVGGIVSIDAGHKSRLATPGEAVYYVVTLALQLLGYVLTMAAGVHVGLSAWRARNDAGVRSIATLRIPPAALRDAGWLYVLATPIFLLGSLWEFLT